MMNEEKDQFERRLSRRPLRPVPAEWRDEILTAVAADANRRRGTGREFTFAARSRAWLATVNAWLSALLWPRPAAWAGLAALWILILAADYSARDKVPVVAGKSSPPSPEMMVQLRQQQRMLVELIGANQTRHAEPPKTLPFPRSERESEILTA